MEGRMDIQLYLISGFLGSGKTTFLQRLLQQHTDKKVGVIINEFGSISIDGIVIKQNGIDMVEINNGSIFCSCLKPDFIKTLIEFSKTEIDVLLIENSGMADPSNISQLLDDLKGKISRPYQYQGAICITDATTFSKYVRVLTPVQNQIASSNFIVLNKIDMANQEGIKMIIKQIQCINPKAYIYQTMYCDIPRNVLAQHLSDSGYIGETSNTCYNRPATYSLEFTGDLESGKLQEYLEDIKKHFIRIKGFVKRNSDWLQVNVVEDITEITEVTLNKKTELNKSKLVFIGMDATDMEKQLEVVWKKHIGLDYTLHI
jgi:G3E family GTPase